MSRNALIGLLVALVVIGIPVVVVLAAGGDDDQQQSSAQPTASDDAPPGAGPVAAEERTGPPPRGEDGDRVKRRGGPPKDKVVYRGPPPEPRAIEAALRGVAYPDALTPAGVEAATIVERRLGRWVDEGQPTVIAADCRGGTCSLRIRSEPRGTGRILGEQALVLRGLFADEDVRAVVIYIHHVITGKGKNERPGFIKISCRRAAHPGFGWSTLTARQLPRRCRLEEQGGGKLRNQVRRGKLSNGQASRNANGGTGSPGAPQKPVRLTPAQRRAQREEAEELRRKQEAEQKRQVQSEQEAGRG